jgi:hypothetical protein
MYKNARGCKNVSGRVSNRELLNAALTSLPARASLTTIVPSVDGPQLVVVETRVDSHIIRRRKVVEEAAIATA